MNLRLFITMILCLPVLQHFAPEQSKIKFGKVSPGDLKEQVYASGSNANAVVIAGRSFAQFPCTPAFA